MRRLLAWLGAAGVLAAGALYAATAPRPLPAAELAALPAGDAARGETWFWAGGCSSCHAAAKAEGDDRLKLGGGLVLKTPFGDFVAPNISTHPEDGIGGWSAADFANAMLRGVSPDGRHYYPAFPYPSFTRMRPADVADLWAFLQTLPAVEGRPPAHALRFPYRFRRGLGLWKLAFLTDAPAVALDASDPRSRAASTWPRAPATAANATPRATSPARSTSPAGSPAPPPPRASGRVPNITPGGDVGGWSASDIAYFFETGFTPDFDSVGGAMVAVQENLAMLAPDDRAAIAAYLKAVPPQKPPADR